MTNAAVLELELASDPRQLPEVRQRVQGWVGEHGWSEPQAGEIVLALDEALANVIRHGYGGRVDGRILLSAAVVEDPREGAGLEMRVRDFGRQVDPTQICGRDLEDVRPGGLGVHIIRAMMNSCEYRRADGGGMLLIMRKFKTHRACDGARATESA